MIFDKYRRLGDYHWREYANPTIYKSYVDGLRDWVKDQPILDVGAGDGLIAHVLGAKGLELDQTAVRLAQGHGVPIIQGNAGALPFKTEFFETVFMGDLIEHLRDPLHALIEARRVLRSNGTLYITTPPEKKPHRPYHYREYTPNTLRNIVENLGFTLRDPIFTRHHRIHAAFIKNLTTKLITGTPYDLERNLGRAYNNFMERLQPDEWACLKDHDAMFTTPRDWYRILLKAITENPNAGIFTVVTNRVGNKSQIAPNAPKGHDMAKHFQFGAAQLTRYGAKVRDITAGKPISGVVMVLSKQTWKQMGGFKDGFFGVDSQAHRDVARTGRRVYLLPGLYAYHWYRGDGLKHVGAPRVARK